MLVDGENRCETFFAKTTNLIGLVNNVFIHNTVMNYAGKTGCNIE